MVAYDPKIIQKFADRLYAQARSIIAVCTLIGALAGGVTGYGVDGGGHKEHDTTAAVVIGSLILGAIGFYVGVQRAFHLKLRAQLALCQMSIELNTRGVAILE